ncbi:hypothetical protein GCM10011506_22830 [Marivirga lumbricoides]|uniref:HTH LytTR-type domain-containing protein n=1 Tax=Marivirga lumbricoides TaxID=1046115 RepID=A0ABQ1M8Y1_9BACT|nr:hypothetical protein GCM10011506_22830 [Marivirga lumbricoides]
MERVSENSLIKSLIGFFQQTYPFYYTKSNSWKYFLLIFLIAFSFNFIFEPFNVNRGEHKMSYFWICFLHTFIPSLIALIYFSLLDYFSKSYRTWTVGNEFIHILIVLLVIGIENFLIRDIIYNNPNNWSYAYFFEEIRNTFLVGFLIIVLIIPINYNFQLRKNNEAALQVKESGSKANDKNSTQLIQAQVKADEFKLVLDDLIAVRSDGNYSEFFIQSEKEPVKLLKRISLKELEMQLTDFPEILKTHRGWLVNLNTVVQTQGNAGGYQLTLSGLSIKVPVSRSLIPNFNERMTSLSNSPLSSVTNACQP